MNIDLFDALIILIAGFMAGFVNAIAGGGSLLTLPILVFLGLPPTVANATNRVAILFGAISSTSGFRSKGISAFPYSLWLGISALFGSIIGVRIAIDISGELFNQILAVIMVVIVFYMILGNNKKDSNQKESMDFKSQIKGIITFFFVGIYGGFIHAGVGFIIMALLTSINKFPLAKTNSAKVFVVVIYTLASVVFFALEGKINWSYGLILAVGMASGAWISSRWSVNNGDVWVKRILIIMVLAFALKLSGIIDLMISNS